ncbi:DmsE family decaheme c-type cytochrome [Ideonella sp.]|uniref:DmsE family decaheme c-type cytochrome n=1 Tax=Ideonella sp. TaxID=1929293 RepID=UPI002B469C9C|nr:DmsE family decaheme c-type cytochrome [Ideonella sp.]HJV70080.1 DmsE family decaheme c-type cytochrome [Ideonella sp.]
MRLVLRITLAAGLMLSSWLTPAFAAEPPGAAATTAAADAARRGLAEDAKCTRCHDESESMPILSIYQTAHGVHGDGRTPTCQSCHGASEKHLAGNQGTGRPRPDVVFNKHTFPVSEAGDRSAPCAACHKGTQRSHWEGSAHEAGGVACNDCHKVHEPRDKVRERVSQREACFACHKEQRADVHKISTHPIDAGKVACSDCHNPHGSTGPKLLKTASVVDTCLSCHAEKRGPFLWEHQPVNEDCTACHTPHGSNLSPLLKARAPFLCDDCHDGPHNSQAPYGPGAGGLQNPNAGFAVTSNRSPNPSSSAAGRACLNCHAMIHGSNSPAGAFLHR